MYKLMIVDDELLEREGIRELLDWEGLGIKLVGEAVNGLQALDLAREQKPDIVLTDIRMPGMNGIELARELKKFLPGVKVIFISGYQDIEYLKGAITLQANGYVLKPVDDNELLDCLKKAIDYLDNEKKSLPLLQQEFLMDVISGRASYEEDELREQMHNLELPFAQGCFCVAAAKIDDYKILADKMPEKDIQSFDKGIVNIADSAASEDFVCKAVKTKDDQLAIIINFKKPENISFRRVTDALEQLIIKIKNTYSATVTIGLSGAVNKCSDLQTAYMHALEAVSHQWLYGRGQVIHAGDTGDSPGNKSNDRNTAMVGKAIDIIKQRYCENLSIEDISSEIFLSASHLRSIFKQYTGQTILEFLIKVRMTKASEFMMDPSLKVIDIARKVGYDSTSYFCQVFKQFYGITPKEYMDSVEKQ